MILFTSSELINPPPPSSQPSTLLSFNSLGQPVFAAHTSTALYAACTCANSYCNLYGHSFFSAAYTGASFYCSSVYGRKLLLQRIQSQIFLQRIQAHILPAAFTGVNSYCSVYSHSFFLQRIQMGIFFLSGTFLSRIWMFERISHKF